MENTSGIFLVLGVGGILGFIVAVIDFLINASKIAVKEKVSNYHDHTCYFVDIRLESVTATN